MAKQTDARIGRPLASYPNSTVTKTVAQSWPLTTRIGQTSVQFTPTKSHTRMVFSMLCVLAGRLGPSRCGRLARFLRRT